MDSYFFKTIKINKNKILSEDGLVLMGQFTIIFPIFLLSRLNLSNMDDYGVMGWALL